MRIAVSPTAATVLAASIHDWAQRHGSTVSRQDEALALVLSGAAYERGATVDEAVAAVAESFGNPLTTSQPRAS